MQKIDTRAGVVFWSFLILSILFHTAAKSTWDEFPDEDADVFYVHSPLDFDLDADVASNYGCGPDQFYCDNDKGGKCIPKKWVCDHEYDCEDRTDENDKCPTRTCGPGQFHCRLTGICIPMGYRCDREVDCGFTITGVHDRSDEDDAHCNLTLNCPANQHKCLTVDTCVELSRFCDKTPDCPDLSDEGAFCNENYNVTCKYSWKPTQDLSARCFCPTGKRPKGPDCVDDDECSIEREGGFSPCDQTCTNFDGGYNCSCVKGYTLNGKSECIAQNVPPTEPVSFLIANGEAAVHIDMNLTKSMAKIEGKMIQALDFDHRNRTVCWVATVGKEPRQERRVLQCASIDNFDRNHTWSFDADYSLEGVEQIAKDWISGNWYFIDDSYDRLFVCNWNVSICQTLLSGVLDKPKDMAIDPRVGYIFVTDWSSLQPGLLRLNMDGSNMTRLVNLSIIYPYGLTLDYPNRMVFWLDNYLEYIHGIDYEGMYKRRVVASGHQMKSLYALTTFEKYLYASDYFKPFIFRITKSNGTQVKGFSSQRDFHRAYTIRSFHRQRQPEMSHPCSENNGGCEHLCIVRYLDRASTPNAGNKDATGDIYNDRVKAAKCLCRDGYRLEPGGRCVLALKYPFLLFGKTAPGTLLGVPLEPPKAGYQTMAPVRHLQRPTAVALMIAEETMYFSDAANFTIQKRKIGESTSEVVMDEGISNCEGLAIDWMARNLYWSDEGLLTINAARLENPALRKVIAEGNMSHPRAVVVHPKAGYIFWTDWADLSDITAGRWVSKIERADLDGGNRLPLVKSQVHWPNGLAIDYGDGSKGSPSARSEDKAAGQGWLYWCDAYMDRIERVRFDGSERQTIVDSHQVAHPYGLAYFGGYLYWTEFRKGQILRINVNEYVDAVSVQKEKPNPVEMYQDSSPLFEVHVFDKNGQRDRNLCSDKNGGCEQFCFYDARQKSVSCECADGFRPSKVDPKACERDPFYETRRRCSNTQFECKRNHRCIDLKYVCDSDNDCKDFSDEDTSEGGPCHNHTCTEDQFHCKSNRCIPRAWMCDGDSDCQGGEDEHNCSVSDCGPNKFQCKISKKCILSDWVCDHEFDCGHGDTSDEHENCPYPKCRNDQFECHNKQCIPAAYICDGDRDCRDGSDEMHCDINCIQGQEFSCTPHSPCISVLRKCDGYPDCIDGSDERNCERNAMNCTKNQFQCATSGDCIRSIFQCDGDADCVDGSDEAGCPKLNCQPHSHFECRDGSRCIVRPWLCDGFEDCADGSDEENCTIINPSLNKCVAPNFPCKNDSASCIEPRKLCNGRNDCADGSDEGLLCDDRMCEKNSSLCGETCFNSPSGFLCACTTENFKLQPDGRTCSAQDPCTKWGVCSQFCQSTGSHYFCWCDKDYELAADKFTCKSTGPAKPYIIFSNRHELRLVGLRDSVTTSLAVNLRNTIAIDFYYQDETKSFIFWTDIATDKIYRGSLENFALTDVRVIVEHGIATAEGIAVDWIAHNLYWVDSSLDQIEVSKFDGRWRTTVVSGQMQNLRAIAVDPRKGLMFWTDWEESNPRIERCTLAGNERIHNLFHVSSVQGGGWPNGLTADYVAERIYWIDAKSDSIHTITYEGKDHRQVLRGHDFLSHPFAIAIFEDKMYWTDWRVNSIVRANKWNGSDVQIIQGTSAQPFDIHIIHPSRQPQRDKNPCSGNGGCSHLCLLNSNVSSICKCPYLMKLASDNRTCEDLDRALLFAQPMAITGIDLQAPYANAIPVLANALVENVSSLDIDMSTKMIYWTDIKSGAIRRSYLNGSNMQTVIDSGLPNPYGLVVDWLGRNLYFTSYDSDNSAPFPTAKISVSSLNGEFRKVLIRRGHNDTTNQGLQKPSSIVVDPVRGYMYWIDSGKQPPTIEYAFMDGSVQRVLSTTPIVLRDPTSLSIDYNTNRLYWTDRSTREVNYCDLTTNKCSSVPIPTAVKPSAITVGGGWLYFYDESVPQESFVGAIEMKEKGISSNVVVLRNRTSRVRNLKVYDPSLQTGSNACRNGPVGRHCSQLCLALPGNKKGCACATGYQASVSDSNTCEGVTKFLLYADAHRIGGLDDSSGAAGADLLAPLSQVQHPMSLDFHAAQERIYWADVEANRIVSIRRDLTNRTVIIDDPGAKVHSFAVDWIADNIYWTNRLAGTDGAGVIEVARLNGTHRRIVIHEPKDSPRSLHVDPRAGYLFWLNNTGIQRALLDGSDRRQIVLSINITDLAVDLYTESLCWLDANRTTISCTNYDGLKYRRVFSGVPLKAYLTAFTINDKNVYWSDKNAQQGGILMSSIGKDGAVQNHLRMIKVRMQSTINDLKVFDYGVQSGTNPCSKNNGGCEHLCLYRGQRLGHVCACSFAKLNSDNKTCSDYDAFIVYSRVQRIDFAKLSEDEDPNTPYAPIDNRNFVRNVIGLAYDYENRRLFYSDIQLGSIMAAEFHTTNKSHQVYEIVANQGSVEGLAYDYIHQDLYWTSYSNASINRATVKMGHHPVKPMTVLQLASIDKPRGIAVDPCEMQIYWTNWNEAKPTIERSFLSGAMRQSIVQTDLKTPNALTVDFIARKLYWSDARLDKIERCELDGTNRVVVSTGVPSHVFGMAVYGDYLYWTDWIMRAVVRINKYTGGDFAYVKRNFTRQPMGIIVVANDSAKCGIDACTKERSIFCQDICSLDEYGRPHCRCRENRVLQPDNATCLDLEPLCNPKTMFQCKSGRCIPYEYTCDGGKECPDADDEEPSYCANRKCREGYFRCKNGQCVNMSSVCNGINNCGDFSDEFGCACDKETQFRCQSGMCIAKNLRCNNYANCNDASDELECRPKRNCSALVIAGRPMVNCNYTTQCILPSWICDGHNDCWDNSDEVNCSYKVSPAAAECLPTMFQCANTRRCIPPAWRCDGDKDCSDGSDEINCKEQTCLPKHEFQCHDKVCILSSWTCDGTPDCTNGEDEDENLCKGSETAGTKSCSGLDFLCSNGRCIPQRWVCDGENDCNDSEVGSDEKNCTGTNLCPENYFQCKNGQCILSAFYCDRDNDCGDRSDEPPDCVYRSCDPETQFQCKNGRCIPIGWLCNGIQDCKDKSDEDEYTCKLRNDSTLCKQDEYACQNRVCIDEDLVCDSHNDCGDWSDEGPLCNKDECAHMNNPCDHICKDEKQGYKCQCHEGYKLAADQRTCLDLDECNETLPCSQLCVNRPGSYTCVCQSGYALQTDGKSCKHSSSLPAELLVSNRYYIWRFTVDGRSKGHVLSNMTNAVAVDYDWLEQRVYWSDVTSSRSRIGRVYFNGSGWEILHVHTLRNPDGLAVDWAGRNLYWCDKGVDTIEVSRLDGRYRKVLMRQQYLQEPRAIIVDPHSQLLFWSDWGENAHIGRMGMDGTRPKLIVEKSLKWPNALTLDYVTKQIFWGDAGQDYIGMSDYDGNRVRVISTEVNHIFSIAVFEDFLYWTDWETGRVERAHKFTGKNRTVVVPHLDHRPMGIRVVHPLLQPKQFFNNPCANGGWCSNLCLLSPEPQRRTCACPEGFKKQGRLDCVPDCKPSEFVCEKTYKCLPLWWRCDGQDDCGDGQDEMYFKPGACPPFNCTAGEFQCYDGAKCVQPSRICDGNPDCDDHSDEGKYKNLVDCETYQCISGQWKCPNSSKCISEVRRCDGRHDCPRGEDEADCLKISCPPTYFRCSTKGQGSSLCLPRVFFCDSELDCPDGSDEPPNCTKRACFSPEFRCNDGQCIDRVWVCDGTAECEDGSDEESTMCRNRTCSEREFKCQEGRCIPHSARCDGDNDCKQGEDEINCANTTCDKGYFRCNDGRCIPASWRCDLEPDCSDNSDETNCQHVLNCTNNEFRCLDGRRCIQRSLVCNGKYDCTDRSDEAASAGCSTSSVCHPTQFACANKRQCIPLAWKCDGEFDCFDNSDEGANCSTSCNSSQFQCTSSKRCINALFQCDGQNDCEDASDEHLARCMIRPCPPGFFKCKKGTCFPAHLRCDGVRHCQDSSDETDCTKRPHCDFTCNNGRCIRKDYLCDGYDDCGDGSDESKERCSPDPCQQFGVCSQKCTLDKNTRQHKCYCDDGYDPEPKNHLSCKAIDNDPPPMLMLAGEQEIRYMNLRDHRHFDTIPMSGERLHSLAVRLQRSKAEPKPTPDDLSFVIYWTNFHKGEVSFRQIQYATLDIAKRNSNRGKRAVKNESPFFNTTLISDGVQPRGIAVDYLHGNLYWADSGQKIIGVMNINSEGREYRNLISWNLDYPYAVVVAPEAGILFWTDVGPRRKIENSALDGSGRRLLVNKDLVYPTGLAVDLPNSRLYWADPKTSSIETIAFDGSDRRLVKTFPYGGNKPMYLDVFEDTIYFTTYINHEVLEMSKFGNGTVTPIMEQLPYPASIVIWHSAREKRVETACSTNPCPSNSMCLLGSDPLVNYTCLCQQNEIYRKDVNMCFVSTLPHIGTCPMVCHNGGQCVVTPQRRLECLCKPGYSGPTCQEEICYGFCLNGGTCVVHEQTSTASCLCPIEYSGDRCQNFKCAGRCRSEHGECYVEKESEVAKCRCRTGWAGDQCDTRSDICNNYCYNNGTCYVLSGNKAQCQCPITHRGERCQQCYELQCMHDGVCMQNRCICKTGYQGKQCEVDICQGYCANEGKCVRTHDGPKCKCSPRFGGEKCQKDRCRDLCQNGGICKETDADVRCLCTSRFAGVKCESSVNCSDYCLNGAQCEINGNEFICRCSKGYSGTRCENTLACRDYCENGAHCTLDGTRKPVCHCPTGLGGDKCQEIVANSCHQLKCYNGVCEPWKRDDASYNNPVCKCKSGWRGLVCNLPECDGLCLNGGTCVVERQEAACKCVRGFYGNRCEHKFLTKTRESMSDDDIPGTVSAVVVPLVLIMLLGMLIFYLIFVRRRKPFNQFKHTRMHDVDEVQNPVFLRGGDDGDDLDALVPPAEDMGTTFSNPMYDSVYNDTVISESAASAVNVAIVPGVPEISEERGLLGTKAKLEMNQDDFD